MSAHLIAASSAGRESGDLRSRARPRLPRLAARRTATRRSHRVAGRRLELHHVGTEIGEHLGRVGAGQVVAEVEDLHTLEREPGLGARTRRGPSSGRPLSEDVVGVRAVDGGRAP